MIVESKLAGFVAVSSVQARSMIRSEFGSFQSTKYLFSPPHYVPDEKFEISTHNLLPHLFKKLIVKTFLFQQFSNENALFKYTVSGIALKAMV